MATAANPFDIQTGAATTNASGTTGGTLTPGTDTTAAQFDPVQRQVNAAQETTSGQLQGILAQDNPLMQQARAQAKQGMAARGLVNSSMAQGAGVAAMLEKAIPIANADANTFATQALTNQQSANVGGQFNAGQQNTFGLQKGSQTFQAGQLANQQAFTATQAGLEREQQSKLQTAQQTFTGAQSALDRAQQTALTDKSIEAQNALQAAQQNFASAQAGLDRAQQTALQTGQQTFTASQNKAQQDLTVAQAALDRAQQTALADKSVAAQTALQTAQQNFAAAQSALDRTQQTALQTGQQTFTAGQAALERTQQTALQTAQQSFSAAQTALDRAQQVALTDKSITAQANLQKAQQDFQSTQAGLDRAQKTALQDDQQAAQLEQLGFQAKANLQNIPPTFASNIANTTMSGVNSIMADGTMTADTKKAAITNLIAYANAQVDWANKFYSASIPPITQPK
jgi:hypothetical protein